MTDMPERPLPEAPSSPGRQLLHAALPADWEAALETGAYHWSTRGRTLAEVGFVHLAYPEQLDGVVERFYADVDALVILVVDRARLSDPVIDEPPAPGVAERFPHLYGPLPLDAVVRTVQWSASSGATARSTVGVDGSPSASDR